jgi:hypothetical protein
MSISSSSTSLTQISILEGRLKIVRTKLEEELKKPATLALEPQLYNLKLDGSVALSWAVANMEIAYESSLSMLVVKIEEAILTKLQLLEELFGEIVKNEAGRLLSIPRRVHELIESLPLDGMTKLTRAEGCPVELEKAGFCRAVFKFQGRFPQAETPQYSPFLVIENAKRPARKSKVGFLEFNHEIKGDFDKPVCAAVTLMVPSFTALWQKFQVAYPVLVKVLPKKIGDIFVQCVLTPNTTAYKKNCVTPLYHISTLMADHPSWEERDHEIKSDDGWSILPNTVEICVHEGSTGNYKIAIIYLSGYLVKLKVGLAANEPQAEGRLYFTVKYDQAARDIICDKKTQKLKSPFCWGETTSLVLEAARYKVDGITLKTLDGAHHHFYPGVSSEGAEFFSLGRSPNRYLAIQQRHGELSITAQNP